MGPSLSDRDADEPRAARFSDRQWHRAWARRLLDLLQRDATTTLTALGEAVGLSPSAVQRRIKRYRDTLGNLAHSLKTPLALIQLFAETLELGRIKSTERAAEYYRIINGEARKLTRLIDNIRLEP